jgi:beta-glucanase (GH16 family)
MPLFRTALTLFAFMAISLFSSQQKNTHSNTSPMNNSTNSKQSTEKYTPGEGWTLDWADEFDGPSLDTRNWNRQIVRAGQFNEEWQRYTDSDQNAYIEDSCLVIAALHESDEHGFNQYTSARLNTANKKVWTYGKIAARIKLPQGKGIWPAFWMLGANIDENGGDTPWPQSGEIDILELYGSKNDGAIEANIHYADASDKHAMMGAVTYTLDDGKFADDFHIFELQWDEQYLRWFVDGKEFASTSIASKERTEFHKDFFLLLNIAVGGTYAGRPDNSTVFPQRMYVDWIRVYKKKV